MRFSATLLGDGGQSPYTWSATGVPAGLALAPNGVLSGVPARSGSFTFTARVVDASGTPKDTRGEASRPPAAVDCDEVTTGCGRRPRLSREDLEPGWGRGQALDERRAATRAEAGCDDGDDHRRARERRHVPHHCPRA